MTEILKFASIGIVCTVVYVLVRQLRPEFAPFIQSAGLIVMTVLLMDYLKKLLESASELFSAFDVLDIDYLYLLIKVLGIAVVSKIGADICNDSGNSALAGNVELAGKVLILFLSFSLIKTVTELAGGLIK